MRSGELRQLHPPGGYVPRWPEELPAHTVQRAIDKAGTRPKKTDKPPQLCSGSRMGGHVMALDYLI